MAEVFTISGPGGFGQAAASCPVGWQQTPNGNCGAPVAGCPPELRLGNACRSPAAIQLQNALKALGKTVGDPALVGLAVDGFIGPGTTAAANRAFTTHLGAGQATARFRTGVLTQSQVANEAALMASVISAEVARRSGTVPAPPVFRPSPVVATAPATQPYTAPATGGQASPAGLWGVVALSSVAAATGFYTRFRRGRVSVQPTVMRRFVRAYGLKMRPGFSLPR